MPAGRGRSNGPGGIFLFFFLFFKKNQTLLKTGMISYLHAVINTQNDRLNCTAVGILGAGVFGEGGLEGPAPLMRRHLHARGHHAPLDVDGVAAEVQSGGDHVSPPAQSGKGEHARGVSVSQRPAPCLSLLGSLLMPFIRSVTSARHHFLIQRRRTNVLFIIQRSP